MSAEVLEGVVFADLRKHLRGAAGVLVQDTAGLHSPFAGAVRVSSGPRVTPAEPDRFVTAIRDAARRGIPRPASAP